MNKNPLISIILPTYNGERYLAESLASILTQTYTNWELIIVNDSSTDNTPILIEEFKRKDPRIRVINNSKNQKLPKSLNIGFKDTKGELLTWTSDDNLYLPNALSEMVNLFQSDSNLGFVFCAQEIIDKDGAAIESIVPKYKLSDLTYKNICGGCFMYTKEAAKIAGEYNIDLFCAEDYDYFCRLALNAKTMYYPKILYRYRKHSGNLSATRVELADINANTVRSRYADELMAKYKPSWLNSQYIYYKLFKCTRHKLFALKACILNPLNILKILYYIMNIKDIDRISRYLTFFIPIKDIRRNVRKKIKGFIINIFENPTSVIQIEQVVGQQKDICFGIIGIDFRYPLYQRPQHLAVSIKKQKRECLYFDDTDISCDCINGIRIYNYTVLFKLPRKVAEKICLILPSGIPIENFSANEYIRLRKTGFKIVYEYLDAFDEKISSIDNHLSVFRILKDFPPDFFVATAKRLYNQLRSINKNIPIILNSNGVEIEAFKNVDDSVPNDLQQILANGKKIVGYYGAIAPWLDYELINKATLSLSNINFVFIGCNYNNGLSALTLRKNVYYLGIKNYSDLPHYSKYFDACIIPFETGEIAKSTSPLKLFEYMAAGKPCVCTRDLEECKGYKGVLIAEDSDDFIEKIKVAIELSKNDMVREQLYEYARLNSWEQKAKYIIELVERNTSREQLD